MKKSISNPQRLHARNWRAVLTLIAAVSLIAGMLGITLFGTFPKSALAATGQEPCDIYASYGAPCVAAHSTVRALYAAYNGPLYQIQRSSDGQYLDIGLLAPGGYANAAPQVSFCANTTCTITKIYDQSPEHNDLPISLGGYWKGPGPNGSDLGANAMALPVTVGGHQVYGVKINPGMGYRIYHTKGVATGSQPQGAYMVTSSSNVNSGCCFDYGNAETDGGDDGNGTMDAVYFGTLCWFGYVVPDPPCAGSGPWVMADMENGLFAGGNGSNTNNLGNKSPFVTALVKNNGTTTYAIKGGNAQSGGLTTWYNGALPNTGGYTPMRQEGSIILGTGGDNSNGSSGEFFEGLMTAGYPSDAADNAVQANIVAAGYGSTTPPPSPTPTTPTPSPTPNGSGYAVNAGGSAVGTFAADEFYDTGSTYSTTATIDTSAVTNPAPQAVYQSERYGNFTYTFPNLSPGAQYTVRLHESENYWTSSGQRSFNVSINGQQVLSNFDIYAAAGGADKAIVEPFNATADSSGTITIQFTSVKDNAKVDGIEILASSSATPTPTPTNTPTPTPTSGTGGGMACSVQYTITNQWSGGFGTSITITNTGSTTINGWTLTWSFANGQTITQIWNGSDTQSGSNVSVTNVSYNGTIAPGGNTNFGFNGSWNGSNAAPTAFSLNGTACAVG